MVHLELQSATILDVADRDSLRATFDVAADMYDRTRPESPDALFDALIELTDARPGDHVLEIGCGTGQATRPLSARGFRITCLEIGAKLAAVARRNLGPYEGVHVINESFEAWPPPHGATYDVVLAATSWHWIDPGAKYRKAWELLRPGGHLAFWSAAHVFPDDGDPFFRGIQEVYDEIGHGLPPTRRIHAPETSPITNQRSREPGYSTSWRSVTSIGRRLMTRRATSSFYGHSRVTSRWSRGSATASSPRSGGDSRNVQMDWFGAVGALFCTSPVGWASSSPENELSRRLRGRRVRRRAPSRNGWGRSGGIRSGRSATYRGSRQSHLNGCDAPSRGPSGGTPRAARACASCSSPGQSR